jgi:hypothetical protein
MPTLRPVPGYHSRLFSSLSFRIPGIILCGLGLACAPGAFCQSAKLTAATTFAPVPDSPLEMVNVPARLLISQQEPAQALALFDHAGQKLSLHGAGVPAFQLKVSFTSSGQTQYESDGAMEEISAGSRWRWTAQIGSSAQTHLSPGGGVVYSSNPHEPIPMRVQMVRGAIFAPIGYMNGGGDTHGRSDARRQGIYVHAVIGSRAQFLCVAAMV